MTTPALPPTRYLLCERSEGWLTIWINRPEVKNALSNEVFEEFRSLAAVLRTDLSIRGVTLRGKGGIFSAGGDLQMFRDIFQGADVDPAEVVRSSRMYGEIYREIDMLPQVVVALVEGAAIAGGLGLVCVADVTIVTKSARFALTETTLGIPPAQIAPLIVRAIGPKAARRLMLTASRFDGAEAGRLGIADIVVDDAAALEDAEAALRKQVLKCAPEANAATKSLLLEMEKLEDNSLIHRAASIYTNCMLGAEGREGVAAFFEKRRPIWSGGGD